MYQNILVVCIGNICRSPTGACLLKNKLPELQISSAGIRALTGKEADPQAVKAALKHGTLISGHSARQLTAEMCAQADLILVMEPKHIQAVVDMLPSARSKTLLFAQWSAQKTIPDPFRQSDDMFESVYLQLENAAQQWANKLSKHH